MKETFHLINYKGKFNIIQDKELLDEPWDVVVGEIDLATAIKQSEDRARLAMYYGVPCYIGKNKKLNKAIEKSIEKIANETGELI